jgi:hypothetical protein
MEKFDANLANQMVINFSLVLNDTYGPDETVKNCGKNTQS